MAYTGKVWPPYPDPRAQSASWLYNRSDINHKTRIDSDEALEQTHERLRRRVERMPCQVVRLVDGIPLAGWYDEPDTREKMRRFINALGDPKQKRMVFYFPR